jgi:3-dehydroquinate dehydratase/shikimate dehydrogenase
VAKICLCLTAKTIKQNLEILDKYRKYTDLAELRVDCLAPDERFLIRSFPEQAGLPVILAIRRSIDGGYYTGGEGARINLLAQGLAFADANRRKNFAFVDIEEDLDVPSLEEAARTFGTRIIRSYHNINGRCDNLTSKIRDMKRNADDLVKIAIKTNSTADVLQVLRAGRECPEQEKILVCKGHYGAYTRILAEQFGSYLSYTSAFSEPDIPKETEGQFDIQELAELYRFRNISASTKVYGLLGKTPAAAIAPGFFNTIFALENIDAVYTLFPADSLDEFMKIAEELSISGLSVAVPYREEIMPYLYLFERSPKAADTCNTLSRSPSGWIGTNTEARAFSDSLLEFLGRKNLKWKKITVIGAGGAAKTVASEIHRLGGKALILNRTIQNARDIAFPLKFAWGGLDSRGIEMMDKYRDIVIQAAATEKSDSGDPFEMCTFNGFEEVMNLDYEPESSPFSKRAEKAGCRLLGGYDMLIRQARYQYEHFLDRKFPRQYLTRFQFRSKNGD